MAVELKDPVTAASEIPVTVSKATATTLEGTAPLAIDGSGFPVGTRLLLKDQVSEAQNGIYGVTTLECLGGEGELGGSGKLGEGENWVLTRTSDADSTEEVKRGMLVPVSGGDVNQRTSWMLTSNDPITVGTTAQTFAALFATPGGVAGGDLDGTYSEPSVVSGGSNSFT
jgi:hypothetical protein